MIADPALAQIGYAKGTSTAATPGGCGTYFAPTGLEVQIQLESTVRSFPAYGCVVRARNNPEICQTEQVPTS